MSVDRSLLHLGTAMALNVVDLEIGRDDVVYVRLLHGTIEIEAMFYAHLTGRVAIFSRLDILARRRTEYPRLVGVTRIGAVGDGVA
jgi:hypothetical protein